MCNFYVFPLNMHKKQHPKEELKLSLFQHFSPQSNSREQPRRLISISAVRLWVDVFSLSNPSLHRSTDPFTFPLDFDIFCPTHQSCSLCSETKEQRRKSHPLCDSSGPDGVPPGSSSQVLLIIKMFCPPLQLIKAWLVQGGSSHG